MTEHTYNGLTMDQFRDFMRIEPNFSIEKRLKEAEAAWAYEACIVIREVIKSREGKVEIYNLEMRCCQYFTPQQLIEKP